MEEITTEKKNKIRQKWCDQLCHTFNSYYQTGKKESITIPLYTAQVLSTFNVLDFSRIDFEENRINMGDSRSINEDLIFECFDKMIKEKVFVGDLIKDFRGQFSMSEIPF